MTVFSLINNDPLIFQLCCFLVAKSCPTLCDHMDCSPLGSSVCGTSHARILEWVAISFSRGSSQPRDQTCISCVFCIAGRFFTCWAIREAQPVITKLLGVSFDLGMPWEDYWSAKDTRHEPRMFGKLWPTVWYKSQLDKERRLFYYNLTRKAVPAPHFHFFSTLHALHMWDWCPWWLSFPSCLPSLHLCSLVKCISEHWLPSWDFLKNPGLPTVISKGYHEASKT